MTDLVSGGFQQFSPFWNYNARLANATQADVAARSNLEWFGPKLEELGTIAASEKGLLAAIPVTAGDTIANIRIATVIVEAEASSEIIGAIYPGVADGKKAKVIAETAVTKEQFKKEKGYSIALKETVLITPSNAPNGFVYAGVFIKETTPTMKIAGWKLEKKFQLTNTTAKKTIGAYAAVTWASAGSFASAKEEEEIAEGKVTAEVPYIILT